MRAKMSNRLAYAIGIMLSILTAYGITHCQTDIIPSTATTARVSWQDGGHSAGDIILYDMRVQTNGVIRYEYSITATRKDFVRGAIPDSGTISIQAWSALTEKSSEWSISKAYKWLKDGQTPEPEPPDTVPDVPVAGWPVVYDAYNMSILWKCDKNWYNALDDKCLMIPSSINPTFPAFAEITIEFPTDSEYFIRIDGYDNGVKIQVDNIDLFTIEFAERGFTSGIGKKWLTKGYHTVRIYGWKNGTYNIGRVRETRFYREIDYANPGIPNSVKTTGQ
jgi:hypothetical protein